MYGKKICGLILALAMALSLCSCSNSSRQNGDTVSYPIPSWIADRKTNSISATESNAVNVNFYYDNTTSMYPFVCNADGESNVDGKATVSGPLVNWISAIREIIQTTDGTVYTLQADKNDELTWNEYPNDIHNNFSNKNFYTFHSQLPKDGDADVGPLAQLYYENAMDPSAVNIVLTDLAEQSVNNTELAACINRTILSQEGYGAAIIAVQCAFNGVASVPNPAMVSNLLTDTVHDERPLYMILTGPDTQLRSIYDTLINGMEQHGMHEGDDFYTYFQSGDAAINGVKDSDIVIPPELAERSDNSFKRYFENSVFYDNLSLEQLSKGEVSELFGSEEYLKESINVFRYQKPKSSNRMVLNYYIPLNDYEKFGDSYVWRLAYDIDEEQKNTDNAEASALLEGKDYLKYDYIVPIEVEVEESADTSDEENTRENRRKKNRTSTQTVYEWYCDQGNEATLKNFNDSFTVSYEQIDFESDEDHILLGADIYDKNGEHVVTDGTAGRGVKAYELDASDEIDLSAADHWIHITVEGTGTYESSTVAFDLPIYAYVTSETQMPAWVSELNATATDSGSSSYYTHTFNLTGFYSTLFGVNTQNSESLYQAQREVKIADIVTVITDLPEGKSR